MRILHVLDHSIPLHSGYTFRTRAILQQQRALGWETAHITSPKHNAAVKPGGDEEEVDGLRFFRTAPSEAVLSRLPGFDQLAVISALERRLDSVVDRVKPDILHAHSPALNGQAALRVSRRKGIPLVYEIRAFWEDAAVDHGTAKEWGLRYRLTRALETHVVKGADAVTTICEGLRGDLVGRGIPENKITVIPNAVDIEKFQVGGTPDPDLLGKLGLHDKLVLGFIGSFYAYEGLALLLESLPLMLSQNPLVRVLLVGGGPQEAELKAMTERMQLGNHVVFTGRVPHEEVQKYYDLVDVLVYPRLSMRLTELVTPLKPLEAMAQGRLLIASDVGGHRELIEPGVTGDLFRAGDAAALADSALRLAGQRDRWPVVRAAARAFVERERNWLASIARYRPVYKSVLGGRAC